MHRPIHSIPEAGKALRKRDRLQVGGHDPRNRKEYSPTHVLPRHTPGPWAGGHCGWLPTHSAERPALGSPCSARPSPPVFNPARDSGFQAARRRDSDYRFTQGARPPSPRRRALMRPRATVHLFFSIHADAQRCRQRGRRRRHQPPDWLAAAEPALSHGPWRVRLSGGAAGAAPGARPGQSGRAGRAPAALALVSRLASPARAASFPLGAAGKVPRSQSSAAKQDLVPGRSRGSPWPPALSVP